MSDLSSHTPLFSSLHDDMFRLSLPPLVHTDLGHGLFMRELVSLFNPLHSHRTHIRSIDHSDSTVRGDCFEGEPTHRWIVVLAEDCL